MYEFHEIQWYDRNPTSINNRFVGEVGPHDYTERTTLTYEIPKNRMFFLENAMCEFVRTENPDASGIVSAEIFARGHRLLMAEGSVPQVGDSKITNVGRTLILREGETVYGRSRDLSSGGVIEFHISYHGIEFDAYEYVSPPVTRPIPEKADIQEPKKFWWWPF